MSVRIYASEAPEDVKQRHKLSYNALAATYNMWTTKQDHRRLKYLDELFARVPKLTDHSQAPVVLELGCGAGVPTLQNVLCRNNALTAKANDISDAQLDLARSHLAAYSDRVQFHCGDMMEVECEDGSLTAAIALYSIIHLPRDEQSEMVSKIARWLERVGAF